MAAREPRPIMRVMIVVGIDGSDGAARALEFAASEAALRARGLRVVAAWSVPKAAYTGAGLVPSVSVDEFERSMRAAAERQMSEGLAGHPGLARELMVVEGSAAKVLIEQSAAAELLVVGSRGLGGFSGLLLGSVGQHCAHHARCPVVIVPSAQRATPT